MRPSHRVRLRCSICVACLASRLARSASDGVFVWFILEAVTAIRIQAFTPMYSTIALAFTVTAFAQTAICGQFDWPQWQGPARTAHSKETGLLQEWPKDGPPLAWKIKGLGGGDSAPSVAAGRIYGMSHRGGDEMVWALSEKDGKEIWAVRIAPAFTTSWPQSKEGPSATPTVDGDRLYVMGLAGNVACL